MKRTLFTILVLIEAVTAFAQGALTELSRFAADILEFGSVYPQEKVYIQFDNTTYYTGETIWFKAYVVNAADHKRAPSKVLYVDLLSPSGVLLQQQKLKVVAGQADGSFPLVDASTSEARELRGVLPYPSGFYEVRAYTMNMLNFTEDAIFSRVFAVYEKPSEEGAYYKESPEMRLHDSDIEQYRPKTENTSELSVSFYPEGGHLLIGQPCRVAFKAVGKDGLGTDAQGVLEGTDIKLETVHDGMGSFEFTPSERITKAVFTLGDKTYDFKLPEAETEGYAMKADAQQDGSLRVEILASAFEETDTFGLTMTCRGNLVFFDEVTADACSIKVPLEDVQEGVCRLVLFDRKGNVLASRSVYCSNDEPVPVLQFKPDSKHYSPFQQVVLNFNLTDGTGAAFRDRFALSVRDSRGTGMTIHDDLRTSMLLSSDLKGLVYKPEYYFESKDSAHLAALDLLMMVQGWERYDWQTMAGVREFKEKHRVEPGLTLNGWALSPSGRNPLDSVYVLSAVVPEDKTQTEQFTCMTNEDGYFGMDISDFYDKAVLTIKTSEVSKQRLFGPSARLLFERSMTPEIRAYKPAEKLFETNIDIASKSGKVDAAADTANYPKIIYDNIGYLLPEVDIEDKRKFIDYYTFKAFDIEKDIEVELDRAEYTGDVYGYLLGKGFTFWLQDSTGQEMDINSEFSGSEEEVALQIADASRLNGVRSFWYVHNSKKCLYKGIYCPAWSMDTKDIKSVMVFDRVMTLMQAVSLCPLFTKGMQRHVDVSSQTSIQSAENSFNYYLVDVQVKDDHELSTRRELRDIGKRISYVDGYSKPYAFYSPSYPDGPVLGDVDYRRTLYWNPNVVTDQDGNAMVSFYNNSITESFSISCTGMTASGVPYVLESGF